MTKRPTPPVDAERLTRGVDPREVARFLRPQPPMPVPPRTYRTQLPGLIAYGLLGGRVIRGSRQVE
jgi:hypothetical protein